MRTAIGYLRISKNETKSVSLDYQRAEVERTALAHGYKLIGFEVDNGISGKSMANRPGIQNVINVVNNKKAHAVVCYKSDRVSRNGIESIHFESLLAAKKVAYLSATEGIIGSQDEDPLLPFLRGGLNQRERAIISMRTKAALDRKRQLGERLGGGIKYGQAVVNGEVVQSESEAALVRRVYELKDLGYSTRKMLSVLSAEGYKGRRGSLHQTTICRILKAA